MSEGLVDCATRATLGTDRQRFHAGNTLPRWSTDENGEKA